MQTSSTIGLLAKALLEAQKAIRNPNKDSFNPHHNSKFASLSSYIEATKPHLLANGLVLTQHIVGNGRDIGITTMLLHTSGEFIQTTITADASMSKKDKETKAVTIVPADGQAIGSLTTYLRRYAIGSLMNIVGEDDDDAEANRKSKDEVHHAAPAAPTRSPSPASAPVSSGSPGSLQVEFGKYKGRTLGEVFAEDPKWVEWAANRELKLAPDGKPYRKDVAFTAACKTLLAMTITQVSQDAPDDVPF
jgi:hypothetical protein